MSLRKEYLSLSQEISHSLNVGFKFENMKKNFLLPHLFRKIGWVMLIPFLVMCGVELFGTAPAINMTMPYILSDGVPQNEWFGIMHGEDMYMEIWIIGLFLSLLFIALSKEKQEDEMIMQVRLQSLLFALWVTSICSIIETLFIFGLIYAYSLWASLFLFLIIFIAKFRYELYQLNKFEK